MLTRKPFIYLRHGQTDWNLQHRSQGWTDVPLNQTGIEQAELAAARLRHLGVGTIYSSPLIRAQRTAEIVARAIDRPVVIVDDLKEAGWGVCEGRMKGKWFSDWKFGITPEDAEPYREFIVRALRGINRCLKDQGTALIVAHGGTYWAVREHAELDTDIELRNCTPISHQPPADGERPWTLQIHD